MGFLGIGGAIGRGVGSVGEQLGAASGELRKDKLQELMDAIRLQQLRLQIQKAQQEMSGTQPYGTIQTPSGEILGLTYDAKGGKFSTQPLVTGQKPVPKSAFEAFAQEHAGDPKLAENYEKFLHEQGSLQMKYVGKDGQPHLALYPKDGSGPAVDALSGENVPLDTPLFSAWMQPLTKTQGGFKVRTNADGSTDLIPVETTSVSTRGAAGQQPTPQANVTGAPVARPSGGAKVAGAPIPFGQKVPTEVKKSYDSYNSAVERYQVMQDALPRALKGDQQAMLNLLSNHIGMTMGLQKGSRITQTIYDEAAQSAPWLQRVAARWDSDGYLSGVVLTVPQMQQMIELAKVRLEADRDAWQREVQSAKQGYGMTPGQPVPKQQQNTQPQIDPNMTPEDFLKLFPPNKGNP